MRFSILLLLLWSLNFQWAHAQIVHAILVADTNDAKIGQFVEADLRNVRATLEAGLPEDRLRITEIKGGQATPSYLRNTLLHLQRQPHDAVFLYISSHGAFDPSRGHYVNLGGGDASSRFYRCDLVNALTQPCTPRFWALVTDCCAAFPRELRMPTRAIAPEKTLLTHLFLETCGRIDITSSRPEQISNCSMIGSVFTVSFCEVLQENATRRIQWDEVFRLTRNETVQRGEESFAQSSHMHNGIPQRTQIPFSFRTMYGYDVNGLRLGINFTDRVISYVQPGSPADAAGFRVGMKIVNVNDIAITSDAQLNTAINFSVRRATFQVEQNGSSSSLPAQLAY